MKPKYLEESVLSNQEKERSIQYILENTTLKKANFGEFIWLFFKAFDWKIVFWGLTEIFVLVMSVLLALIIFILSASSRGSFNHMWLFQEVGEKVYFYTFLCAPIFFSLFHYLSIWKEIQFKTFELKMTLKVSLQEIMVIRTLLFSLLSLTASVLLSVVIWFAANQELSLLKLISLSSTSLFLFSTGQLTLDHFFSMRNSYKISPIIWLGIGAVLVLKIDIIYPLLMVLPETIVVLMAVIGFFSFILMLRYDYLNQRERSVYYVRT
ncbi:hypothetical protein [Vagococcus carniphilus]|uniref:hypothetical protein n=1 Tax=Vagococcus carniphilus TaxID=218144 RepID=UPI003BAD6A89